MPFPSTQQEKDVSEGLSQAIALCQRTRTLEDAENELLWFRLLDCPVGFLRKVKHEQKQKRAPVEPNWSKATTTKLSTSSQSTTTSTPATAPPVAQPPVTESPNQQREATLQKSLQSLTHLINIILMNMMGYVALPSILSKIVKDHAQHEFGDFKSTIVGMLDTYAYETTILKTANHLIENDMYTATSTLVSNLRKAYSPSSRTCGLCTRPLHSLSSPSSPSLPAGNKSSLQGTIFYCNHAFHAECLGKHGVCPLCTKEDKKKSKHKAIGLPRNVLEDARVTT